MARKRTHKRAGSHTFTPTGWRRIGVLLACPECGGSGFRVFYHTQRATSYGHTYARTERRDRCWLCNGSGVACEGANVQTGPERVRHRSLCSNTGYADPDTLQTSDDWNAVDCPACLACVWNSSPASNASIRGNKRVTDVKAIIVPIKRCRRLFLKRQVHDPHAFAEGDAIFYCEGAHDADRFERNR